MLKHSALLSLQPPRNKRDDEMRRADLHKETLARSALSVRDGRHRQTQHPCGIIGRSNIRTGRPRRLAQALLPIPSRVELATDSERPAKLQSWSGAPCTAALFDLANRSADAYLVLRADQPKARRPTFTPPYPPNQVVPVMAPYGDRQVTANF